MASLKQDCTEAEAIEIANDSAYGPQGWISTADQRHGQEVADRSEAGAIMVNDVYDLFDDAGAPAEGFKQSGIDPEFGIYGIEAYLDTQSIFA